VNTLVLFALAISPNGYVLETAASEELARFAEHEFNKGMTWRHDAATARRYFHQAARLYDTCWRRDPHGPELAMNRANAHRLADELPQAIVALNEGLAVAPWSRPLQMALEDARGAVGYPNIGDLAAQCRSAPASGLGTRLSSADLWLILGALCVFASLGVARFAMTRKPGWVVFSAVFGVVLLFLGSAWLLDHQQRDQVNELHTVVVTQDVFLRKGNSEAYPARLETKLPRGVEARKLTERGGWVQVRLAGGVVGWLPASSVI